MHKIKREHTQKVGAKLLIHVTVRPKKEEKNYLISMEGFSKSKADVL